MGRKQLIILWAIIVAGCASSVGLGGHEIFEEPSSYADERVVLCGVLAFRFENNNIYPSRSAMENDNTGLGVTSRSIAHNDLEQFDNRLVCLSGVIYYRGCTKERICTSSNFLYAIDVESANLPDQ